MTDYISREAAIEKKFHAGLCDAYGNEFGSAEVVLADDIAAIPAADVRSVVTCGECKHYQGVHDCQGHAPCDYWGIGGVLWNDFCSRGVKMEENDG